MAENVNHGTAKGREELHPASLLAYEIDAKIEYHIFGVRPRKVRIKGSTNKVDVFNGNPAIADGVWEEPQLRQYGRPRYFSTDPAAMVELVGKLREMGYDVRIDAGRNRYLVNIWERDLRNVAFDYGDTIAEAVANAALRMISALALAGGAATGGEGEGK